MKKIKKQQKKVSISNFNLLKFSINVDKLNNENDLEFIPKGKTGAIIQNKDKKDEHDEKNNIKSKISNDFSIEEN